ncbi:MAG: glycine--tRNA ligase subunit alpha, partial [Nitrospirae bacterium]|nr:glycine--tRNA ligase subunit alpha [Nitrospirota bacterium]
ARGVLSVTERTGYIARVRALAKVCAEAFLKQREGKGFPLCERQTCL